jgi:hypothetical protein
LGWIRASGYLSGVKTEKTCLKREGEWRERGERERHNANINKLVRSDLAPALGNCVGIRKTSYYHLTIVLCSPCLNYENKDYENVRTIPFKRCLVQK